MGRRAACTLVSVGLQELPSLRAASAPVLLFPLKATRPTAQGYNRNAFRLHVSP